MRRYDIAWSRSGRGQTALLQMPCAYIRANAMGVKMLHLFREQTVRWMVLLGAAELLLFAISMVAATHVRYWGAADQVALHTPGLWPRSLVFAAVLVLALVALGLYQPRLRESWLAVLARQAIGFVLGGIGVVLLYYIVPPAYVGRGILTLALLIAFPLVVLVRILFLRLVDVEALKRRVLVIGAGARAASIVRQMRRRVDRRGFHLLGFVALPGEEMCVPKEQLLDMPADLLTWVRTEGVNEIVIGPDDRRGKLPMQQLLDCRLMGVSISSLSTFFERESGRVQMELTDPSWLLFSGGFDATPLRRVSKRAFDMASALLVMLVTWPFMLLTAAAIMVESGWRQPVLYRQQRVGEHGNGFQLIKFRSMCTDAEKDGAQWASTDDDRVTRVGRFTRKARLDELPQLWNVLRGDMSFVGPRPERPVFVDQLAQSIRYYPMRHCVKPGLTGWAQLNYPYGASEKDAAEKLKYDLYYVKNHSMLLDTMILMQTVEIVLFGRGAR